MENFELHTFATTDELANAVANAWLDEVAAAERVGKQQSVALSGGRIANNLYAAIVHQARARGTSLARVHFFWADERCVPPTDPESNYKVANDLLFSPLKISPAQIHRIRGEDTPEVAAEKASNEIARIVPINGNGQPPLDVIILGIGPDGHTASLFPGEPESLRSNKAIYRAIKNSPKPPPNRVTIGYPAIAAAHQVWVLASGEGKEKVFSESIRQRAPTPFAKVLVSRKITRIFSDLKAV